MRISGWSSGVGSADLLLRVWVLPEETVQHGVHGGPGVGRPLERIAVAALAGNILGAAAEIVQHLAVLRHFRQGKRSEERRVGNGCVSTCSTRGRQDH